MSSFLNENDNLNKTAVQNVDIKNVDDFSHVNPNIKLENLPKFEDIYGDKKTESVATQFQKQTNLSGLQEVNVFQTRTFKKEEDSLKSLTKIRTCIFASCYILVTLILTGFVIYNLVETIILNNQISSNRAKIKEITKLLDRLNNRDDSSQNIHLVIPEDLNLEIDNYLI